MEFDPSYFEDEIRENFLIPGLTKRSWAMQIEVLTIIEDICRKNRIAFFADCGTLIGAVRHRGFIPWDDDLDICMVREDYERFKKIVNGSLPDRFKVINFDTEPSHKDFITRIVNHSDIDLSGELLLKEHGFPYPAGIDIFPLDHLYDDEEREKERTERARTAASLSNAVNEKKRKMGQKEADEWIEVLTGSKPGKRYRGLKPEEKLLRVVEDIFSENKDGKRLALMPYFVPYHDHIYEKSDFENMVSLPFENISINVPAGFLRVLTVEYGKWYKPVRFGGVHDYPFYKKLEKLLLSETGKAFYKYSFSVPDKKYIEEERLENYLFSKERGKIIKLLIDAAGSIEALISLEEKPKENSEENPEENKEEKRKENLKGSQEEFSQESPEDIKEKALRKEEILKFLEKCQNLAIKEGTLLEEEFGEGNQAVKCLERYCEDLYRLYEALLSGEKGNTLNLRESILSAGRAFADIENRTGKKNGRKALFLYGNKGSHRNIDSLFDEYREKFSIKKFRVPYYRRLDDGTIGEKNTYGIHSENPDGKLNSEYISTEEALEEIASFPDIIVMEDPCDEYRSGVCPDERFFSDKLSVHTGRLLMAETYDIYPQKNDLKFRENLKSQILSKGNAYSDEIILENNALKDLYLDIFKESNADDELGKKLRVMSCDNEELKTGGEIPDDKKASRKDPSGEVLLFISYSDLYSGGKRIIDWVRDLEIRGEFNNKKIIFAEGRFKFTDPFCTLPERKASGSGEGYENTEKILSDSLYSLSDLKAKLKEKYDMEEIVLFYEEDENDKYNSLINRCDKFLGSPGRLCCLAFNEGIETEVYSS